MSLAENLRKIQKAVDADERNEEIIQNLIDDCIELKQNISCLGMFSSNEELFEVSTLSLPFILVSYYHAVLLYRKDEDRLENLYKSLELHERFIEICRDYQLDIPNQTAANDADKRLLRISRQKTRKEFKDFLNKYSNLDVDIVDDELQRTIYIKTIELSIYSSLEDIEYINSEINLLKSRPLEPVVVKPEIIRVPTTGPLLSKSGKLLRPFTITSRAQMTAGVFRPGHNLPTMTLDDYIEAEMKRGGIINGGGNENKPKEEQDEDDWDEERQDLELKKKREFEQFKDDNPKGWGNKGGNRG